MDLLAPPQVHIWTRSEYYRIADLGLFENKRVELIEGQIIEMSPMGSRHATTVTIVARILETIFNQGYFLRWQMPLSVSNISEPEPDVAVIAGNVRDYKDAHPTTAVLVVEIADTSLEYDRTTKSRLYAKANVADYWIINLLERQVELFRNPVADPTIPDEFYYADNITLNSTSSIQPLAAPEATILIADLLP